MKSFRTEGEKEAGRNVERIFLASPDAIEVKLENFTKYVRRQHLKRFLSMYEIFKLALPVKGSIVECGVYRGFSLMAWAKLSTILEPENLTRRVYGFDTFEGFVGVHDKDRNVFEDTEVGELGARSYEELQELLAEYDRDRFLGHIPKVELVKGDMLETIPDFMASHPHLLVSLLFLDCDLFEPTKAALEAFVPRMPRGSILAFDELDSPWWPGETLALLETLGINNLRLERIEWDPYISYTVIE